MFRAVPCSSSGGQIMQFDLLKKSMVLLEIIPLFYNNIYAKL